MNRLEPSSPQPLESDYAPSPTQTASAPTAPLWTGEAHPEIAMFVPMHYEPNYAYPLLVWLHGAGDDQRRLRQIMPHVSTRNYAAVAPKLPPAALTQRGDSAWSRGAAESLLRAETRVFQAIEGAESRLHVAGHRVFLVGWGSGGSLALRIALLYPNRFAGVASLGGPFPHGGRPLQRLDQVRSLPLLLACGRGSRGYDEPAVCRDLRLMHTAGICVTLRQYPVGDELTTKMLADLNHWVMAQICPQAA